MSENFLSQPKQINLNLQLVYIIIINDSEDYIYIRFLSITSLR
jgi:hypothetical protein